MSRRHSLADGTGIIADDGSNNATFVIGTTVPSNGAKGYATGCLFLDLDASAGSQVYFNEGTSSSAAFKALPSLNPANELVASGASLTISSAHHGKTIVQAAASAITLPAASGSGLRVRFVNGVTATAVTITADGAYLFGTLVMNTDSAFQAGTLFTVGAAVSTSGSTVITQDGTTRGGNVGDWIEIQDIATNKWAVRGVLNASGTEATPFS